GSGKLASAHDEPITHVAFSLDGKELVTTGEDDKAFVWSLRDGTFQELAASKRETGHTGDVKFASFDQSGNRAVTAGSDGLAILWRRASGQVPFQLVHNFEIGRALTHAVFTIDDRYIVTADEGGTIRLWDADDGHQLGMRFHPGQQILELGCRKDQGR